MNQPTGLVQHVLSCWGGWNVLTHVHELELWVVFPDVSVFKESTKEHLVKEEFKIKSK